MIRYLVGRGVPVGSELLLGRNSTPEVNATPEVTVGADDADAAPRASSDSRRRRRRVRVVAPGALLALLAVSAVAASATVRHQIALSFVRQPDRFTELYFTEPRQLEKQGNAGNALVDFTIANHEGHTSVYPYVVTLAGGHMRPMNAHGYVRVPDADHVQQRVVLRPGSSTTGYTVTVWLEGGTERIHYTVGSGT
jgi:hypothetical protein